MSAPQYDFQVNAGETLIQVFRYASSTLVTKAVSAISQAAPAAITAPAHGMADGWPAAVVSAKGMIEINAQAFPPRGRDWHTTAVPDVNTVQFTDTNSSDFSAYQSGGFLVYPAPVSLAGMTGVFNVFDNPAHSGTPLLAYTTSPNLVFDDTKKTITVKLPTAALAWTTGYYELVVTDTAGNPKELVNGVISILP